MKALSVCEFHVSMVALNRLQLQTGAVACLPRSREFIQPLQQKQQQWKVQSHRTKRSRIPPPGHRGASRVPESLNNAAVQHNHLHKQVNTPWQGSHRTAINTRCGTLGLQVKMIFHSCDNEGSTSAPKSMLMALKQTCFARP